MVFEAKRIRRTGALILFLALSFALQYKVRISGGAKPGLAENTPAPLFGRNDTARKYQTLKQLRGKIVLLFFWGSDYPASLTELEELRKWVDRRAEEGGNQEFALLAISCGKSNWDAKEWDRLVQFAEERKLPFPILLDNGSLKDLYNVRSLPSLFIIDQQGLVRSYREGPSPDLVPTLNALIDGIGKENRSL